MRLVGGMVHRGSTRRAAIAHERAHGNERTAAATADTTSGKVARTLVMSPLSSLLRPGVTGRDVGGSVGHAGPGASLSTAGSGWYGGVSAGHGPSRDAGSPDVRRWGHERTAAA